MKYNAKKNLVYLAIMLGATFSDTIWVVTSADNDTVCGWLPENIEPDDCWEGWVESQAYEEYKIPEDMKPVDCWWD